MPAPGAGEDICWLTYGVLVPGTLDVTAAVGTVLADPDAAAELAHPHRHPWPLVAGCTWDPQQHQYLPPAGTAGSDPSTVGELLHHLVEDGLAGWWRKVPHQPAHAGSRGAFPGVLLP